MRWVTRGKVIGICAFLFLSGFFPANLFGQTLKQVAQFDLPGPGGKRFDYLTIDPDDLYLIQLVACLGFRRSVS